MKNLNRAGKYFEHIGDAVADYERLMQNGIKLTKTEKLDYYTKLYMTMDNNNLLKRFSRDKLENIGELLGDTFYSCSKIIYKWSNWEQLGSILNDACEKAARLALSRGFSVVDYTSKDGIYVVSLCKMSKVVFSYEISNTSDIFNCVIDVLQMIATPRVSRLGTNKNEVLRMRKRVCNVVEQNLVDMHTGVAPRAFVSEKKEERLEVLRVLETV